MYFFLKNRSCHLFFLRTILAVYFLNASAFAQTADNSFEARMHRIYQNHYQKPILDDDWLKIIEGIQEQTYKVAPGDTLWDISEIYFGDGHYWSKLWSMNRNITNPHMIFSGDTIVFKAGTFDQPPSIEVEKMEQILQSAKEGVPTVMIESDPVVSTTGKFYSELPDYFVKSPILNLGDDSKISVIPRPKIQYKSDFYLTNEIFSTEPEVVAVVKSIGGERMVSGESNRIVLKAKEGRLSDGATLSLIDENPDYLKGGYGVHVLAIVKVLKSIDEELYEAEILRQFDGIYQGSAAIAHIPPYVNMSTQQEPREADITILSKDKEIWYTGDVVFLKSNTGDLQKDEILKIHNKFDRRIDFYTQNGILKVVSTKSPFATAVVIHTRTAMERNSVSTPKKSGFSFW